MQLQIALHNNAVVFPAAPVLSNLSSTVPLHNKQHRLRESLGIYNTSIALCGQRMNSVLSVLLEPNLSTNFFAQNVQEEARLIEAYDAFLDAMMEHMDDCLNVLLVFFPDKETRDKHRAVKQYRSSVRVYRDHIGTVVNHIKHGQGRLRLTAIRNHEHFVLGYFVEGVDQNQVIGPAEQVHRDGNNAFSFHRDLRFHFAHLFHVSHALRMAIEAIVSIPSATASLPSASGNEQFTTIGAAIVNLPKTVFPHEQRLDWPKIRLISSPGPSPSEIKIEFPCSYERPLTLSGRVEIGTKFAGDGISKSFHFPI